MFPSHDRGGNGSTGLRFYLDNNNAFTSDNFSLNTWYHVAWIRSGTDSKLFIDGTQNQSTATSFTHNGNSTENAELGQASGYSGTVSGGPYPFYGYIDEFRISRVARYISDFSPPVKSSSSKRFIIRHVLKPMPIMINFYDCISVYLCYVHFISYLLAKAFVGAVKVVLYLATPLVILNSSIYP